MKAALPYLQALVIPLALALLGYFINRSIKRLEFSQWTNQRLVQKRLELFDVVAPALNDLYCFFQFVGNWKELTPPAMIELKRSVDKAMYVHQYLFQDSLMQRYRDFMDVCFQTHNEPGSDAKLRTLQVDNMTDRTKFVRGWQENWSKYFSDPKEVSPKPVVREAYQALMFEFTQSLGIRNLIK